MAMLRWLGEAVAAAREEAGVTQMDVALRIPPNEGSRHVSPSTLSRLEQGRGWPDRVDDYLNAYAEATSTPTLVLWFDALTRWVEGELAKPGEGPIESDPPGGAIPTEVLQALALLGRSRTAGRNPDADQRPSRRGKRRARKNRSAATLHAMSL